VDGPLRQGTVVGLNLALSAGACVVSAAAVSPHFAASVAVGTALELANFRALWASCERTLLAGRSAGGVAAGAFAARLVLLGLAILFALHAGVDAVGLLIGLSCIVPAVLLAGWLAAPPIVPDAPCLAPDDPAWDLWDPWLARERAPRAADEDAEEDAR
jgi:hypothetical protein